MTRTSENRVDDSRARLAAIVESSDDAIVSEDLHGIVTSWNKAAERLFGYAAPEIVGRPITPILPSDRINVEVTFLGRIGNGESVDHYETIRRHKDGRTISVSVTISPIRDDTGSITGASKIARDLTRRDAQEQRIQELQSELAHAQRLARSCQPWCTRSISL